MKAFLMAALTFIGLFVVVALVRGIAQDVLGPGLMTMVINIGGVLLIFYLPFKVYNSNKDNNNE